MAEKNKNGIFALTLSAVAVAGIVFALICYFMYGQTDNNIFKREPDGVNAGNGTEISSTQKNDPTNSSGHYTVEYDSNGNEIYKYTSMPVDFKQMKNINKELYAWIYVPGTQIDNPIAQSESDDSYYISHDIYGNYSMYGTIFTEKCNSKDFYDPNTLIYGHEMLNGSMFQNLYKFEDKAYFNSNPYFYIFTGNRVLTYEIVSSLSFNNSHIMYSYDFSNKNDYQKYIDTVTDPKQSNANVRPGVKLTVDDKTVTLSTGGGNDPDKRYIVVAKLISDDTVKTD